MPEPTQPREFAVKITGTGNSAAYVELRNLSTREYRRKQANSKGQVTFDLQRLSSDGTDDGTITGLTVGDVIEYKVSGYGYGGGTWTSTATGGKTVGVTTTDHSTTNTVGVSI